MKISSLFLASMMIGVSLSSADKDFCPAKVFNASLLGDHLGKCAADLVGGAKDAQIFCDVTGNCSFALDAAPGGVEESVNQALDVLTNPEIVADSNPAVAETYAAQALAMLHNALLYAQQTGNDYLGEYIQAGLETVTTYYEENPVATVVVGSLAVATAVCTAYYVVRGCTRLMKNAASACYGACKSKRRASTSGVRMPVVDASQLRTTRLTKAKSPKKGAQSASATGEATDPDLADQ